MVIHNYNYNYNNNYNNNYRQKYLKYKTKYLELQSKLNNQSGGNLKTAKNSFFNKIFKNKDVVYKLLESDKYLDDQLTSKSIELPWDFETDFEEFKKNPVLNEIFDIIVDGIDDKIIDEYINCLLYTSPSPRDRQKSRMPSSA